MTLKAIYYHNKCQRRKDVLLFHISDYISPTFIFMSRDPNVFLGINFEFQIILIKRHWFLSLSEHP